MRYLLLLLCLQPALLSAAPRVVTSIAPLQEIAAALMHGIGEPGAIIDERDSAHHFAFKPSQMARLQQADLVIWIDRNFESGFGRVPEILPGSAAALELLPALGQAGGDGHFWYAPSLLQGSVDLIATTLAGLDPDNRALYRANARALLQSIETWRQAMQERWRDRAPVILTAHDFLGSFAADFAQFEIESIYDRHDAQSGLKDLRRLDQQLRERPPACLLTLEDELPALAANIADRYRLPVIRVARSGATAITGNAVLQRLERLRSAIERCAAGG